jgi:glyoxylate/hydroxypyruvate reductase A
MAILFNNDGHDGSEWIETLSDLLPAMPIYQYPNNPNLECVQYAVVWNHPVGELAKYPNLKAVLNLGAGTDWLEADNSLPKVPIVRLLDPAVGIDMAHYVVYWVMHCHRGYERYRHQQQSIQWERFQVETVEDYCVTILGLGLIGEFITNKVAESGFKAQAWNRSDKTLDNVTCFSGDAGLQTALSTTNVLVNCLPHTANTDKLLDAQVLGQLPKGAHVINVSRGGVIDHEALLKLLDDGHLASAILDAFTSEPLPAESPLWRHEKVTVTPHMSGATYPNTSAKVIADNIQRIERDELPFPIYSQFDYE